MFPGHEFQGPEILAGIRALGRPSGRWYDREQAALRCLKQKLNMGNVYAFGPRFMLGGDARHPRGRAPGGHTDRMATKRSAGVLLFRTTGGTGGGGDIEVLLGHMGGPFWARRDAGAWSLVKGEYGPEESALAAARREFQEEVGRPLPDGEPLPLGETEQSGGKIVTAWALHADFDPALAVPGTFTMEWPKGSGRMREFPEIDRVAWFTLPRAHEKIVKGQRVFLDRLAELHGG
jgi:predicted NUDIX family NTP pyrophosphohydrolase